MVRPTTSPVDRAVRLTLAMGARSRGRAGDRLVARHREGDDDARAPALARSDGDIAAELHGETADQGQAEAAPPAGGHRKDLWRIEPIVLDHQLDLLAPLVRLDADLGRGDRAEVVVERTTDRLGDDQADRNGDVGTDRHDRRADRVARRRPIDAWPRHRDLPHQVADELLEVDQRPARALVEMAVQ